MVKAKFIITALLILIIIDSGVSQVATSEVDDYFKEKSKAAQYTAPEKVFSITPEESEEIEGYKSSPCYSSLGWEKGRDNARLYRDCESARTQRSFNNGLMTFLKIGGIVLFVVLFLFAMRPRMKG